MRRKEHVALRDLAAKGRRRGLPVRGPGAKSTREPPRPGAAAFSGQMDQAASFGTYAPAGVVRWAVETTRRLPDYWLGRRRTVLIRRLAVTRLAGGPVDVEALGLRMRLLPQGNICEKRMLFNPQTFDPRELALLSGRVAAARGRPFTFVDVGANIGAYSLHVAAEAGADARVLAIEPQPDIFDRLVVNIRLNGFSTVKAQACAVAHKGGDVTLFVDPRNSGESSVKVIATGGAAAIRVPARTLLDLIQAEGWERVDAAKLDVEGAEDLILDPFLADAPDRLLPGLLILENGRRQWQSDLEGQLGRRGYRLLATTRLNLVFERAGRQPETAHG